MSNLPGNPVTPPDADSTLGGSVRRHHTIAAASRAAHSGSRLLAEEQQTFHEDEVVDQEWVGGVGAVGEKSSSLHRQSSLPTRYSRASVFARNKASRQAGNLTPRGMSGLSAIAAEHGLEGDEEEWTHDMGWQNDDDHGLTALDVPSAQHQQLIETQSQGSSHSPLSPQFPPNVPSPPPAPSNIRRIQSLNYGGANTGTRISANLRRSGTLQAQTGRSGVTGGVRANQASNEEEGPEEGDEDAGYQYARQQAGQPMYNQGQYTPTSVGRSSPWGSSSNDWRGSSGQLSPGLQGNGMNTNMFDEVQLALQQLDLSNQQNVSYQNQQQQQGTGLPPRMNATSIPAALRPGNAGGFSNGNGLSMNQARSAQLMGSSKLLDDEGAKGNGVPPIGHGLHNLQAPRAPGAGRDNQQAQNQGHWEQQRTLTSRTSNPNLQYSAGSYDASALPPNPPIPQQYLNQQQQQLHGAGQGPRMGVVSPFQGAQGQEQQQLPVGLQSPPPGSATNLQAAAGFITAMDVPTLIATKGYNPPTFDCKPAFARFFVIKSYTEDDVHKSLKYEIWSSTDPGNKRLDKAFKDTAGKGPIYLFFSVNASGHFCGMAEMMTPVDYSRSSTVWASDKWKGVFKVRWIFVRDIPNATLRHIKLNNTQERKPVTNSRDTQELLPDAGQEMLRIFFSHPARTSLLQDFAFYELQAMQKAQAQVQAQATGQPQSGPQSPQLSQATIQTPQQHPYAMPNPYAAQHLAAMGPVNSMMQMQINATQYSHPHAMQSVMRNPSPIPVNTNTGYMGMNAGAF